MNYRDPPKGITGILKRENQGSPKRELRGSSKGNYRDPQKGITGILKKGITGTCGRWLRSCPVLTSYTSLLASLRLLLLPLSVVPRVECVTRAVVKVPRCSVGRVKGFWPPDLRYEHPMRRTLIGGRGRTGWNHRRRFVLRRPWRWRNLRVTKVWCT